jgi:hypothetical protein
MTCGKHEMKPRGIDEDLVTSLSDGGDHWKAVIASATVTDHGGAGRQSFATNEADKKS